MKRRSVRTLRISSLVLALAVLVPIVALAFDDFADVDTAAFYHADAHWLKERGITLGCRGANYCPNDPVTRGQMAAFLHRTANVRETPGFSLTAVDSAGFVGLYSSATIGVDGRALISYYYTPTPTSRSRTARTSSAAPRRSRRSTLRRTSAGTPRSLSAPTASV